MSGSTRRIAKTILAAALAIGALGGCATGTPYQPLEAGRSAAGGYSDEKLDDNRFRVSFAGNTLTSRETVENYLIFRAAELTLEEGFDWFRIDTRHVEREVERDALRYRYAPYSLHWTPRWEFYGPRVGRYPCPTYPYWCYDIDMREIERYAASADITTGKGAKDASDIHAFDAREVVERLSPDIKYPE